MNSESEIVQNSSSKAPELAVSLEALASESKESNESKPGRGGRRPGAGRKPNIEKRLAARLRPESAIEILTEWDAMAMFRDIYKNGSRQQKLNAWKELQDRAYGRPAQAVSVSGTVLHAHWTPGKYSHLTDEEFAKLAELSAKALAPPTQNALPDAPQNQTESKPAIEAEVVASDTIEA